MRSVVGGVCAAALVAGVSMAVAVPASATPSAGSRGGSAKATHGTHHGEGPLAKAAHHEHATTAASRAKAQASAKAGAATGQAAGTFVSLPPARLLDTRKNSGGSTPVAGGTVKLQVLGKGGVPSSGVSAVVLNVTAVAPTGAGYVTVYADGAAKPTASSLNFPKGAIVPNSVVAPVGTDGKVALYNGGSGKTPLLADVSGYYLSGTPTVAGAFKSLAPSRLLDTRAKKGGSTPGSKGSVNLQVTGQGGVPTSGVSAVILNVTVAGPAAGGYVTVYGSGTTRPTSSNLNFVKGQTIANLVVAPIGTGGKVTLYNGAPGATPLVADVAGYYRSGTVTSPGAFKVLPPKRALDTRIELGDNRPGPNGTVYLAVDGSDSEVETGVPSSDVEAVVLNVTVTNTTAGGYITVFSDDDERPATSNLNFVKGQTVPNLVFSPVSDYGYVDLFNGSSGANDLLADVAGYFVGNDGSVSGKVTAASDGTALPNVDVSLDSTNTGDGEQNGYGTQTDEDGTYSLEGVDAGPYKLCFDAESGDPEDGGTGGPSATGYAEQCSAVTITAGSNLVENAALADGGAISGTVYGNDVEQGIGNVEVDVYGQDNDAYENTTTNSDGSYTVDSLATGSYQVCFFGGEATGGSDGGYQDTCYEDEVSVTEGQTTTGINGVLTPGGAVSGTITLPGATSDDDVQYDGVEVLGDGYSYYGNVNDDGTYKVGGIPTGTYTVCFDNAYVYDNDGNDTDYDAECYVDQPYEEYSGEAPAGSTPVSVTVGSVTPNINATLVKS